jgi:hypothetical protein
MRLMKKFLDKQGGVISYAAMRSTMIYRTVWGGAGVSGRRMTIAATVSVCLLMTGCMGGMKQHGAALSAATAPVVDAAEKAYTDANAIHDLRENYDAAVEFDKTDATGKVYNPRNIKPLLSEKQIDVRLAMLKSLQLYVKNVAALTNGTESKELDEASKSLADGIAGLGNLYLPAGSTSATEIVTTDGQSQTITTTTPTNAISSGEQNGIAAAVNALGQYLGARKVKKELPGILVKMDPQIEKMCDAMSKDVDALKSEELIDFNFMINQQTLFLRENKTMDAGERRTLIMALPDVVRRHQASDEQLDNLKAGLFKLKMTHHALAADAQGNNPEGLKAKVADLASAGEGLGKYYSSLPAK